MSSIRDTVIMGIMEVEGGYVNDINDSGGETNFGITEKVARENRYYGSMRAMPHQIAFNILSKQYWDALSLDKIERISVKLATEIADTAVNMGVRRSGTFLQRSLNVLNRQGGDYADIVVDGYVGKATLASLKAFYRRRGSKGLMTLHNMLNCLQGSFYVELAERREKDEDFINGWFENRVVMA